MTKKTTTRRCAKRSKRRQRQKKSTDTTATSRMAADGAASNDATFSDEVDEIAERPEAAAVRANAPTDSQQDRL